MIMACIFSTFPLVLAPVKNDTEADKDADSVPRILSIVLNRLLLVEIFSVFLMLVSFGVNIPLLLFIDITDIFVEGLTVFDVVVIVAFNVVVVIAVVSDANSFVNVTGFCNIVVVTSEIDNEKLQLTFVRPFQQCKKSTAFVCRLLDNKSGKNAARMQCLREHKKKFEINTEC